MDKNGVRASGGYFIQAMPDATEEDIANIEQHIMKAGAVSKMLEKDMSLVEIAKQITGDEKIEILEKNIVPVYRCDCNKEHMRDGLSSIGIKELNEIIEEDGQAETVCHFCHKKYVFTREELEEIRKELLEKAKKKES